MVHEIIVIIKPAEGGFVRIANDAQKKVRAG